MKNQMYEKLYDNLEVIKKKGCNLKSGLSLIRNNPILLECTKEELDHKLSFIVNHDQIYAALFVNDNDYEWSLCEEESFSSLKKSSLYDKESEDVVIETMLQSIIHNKLIDKEKNLSLEDEIYDFKNTIKVNKYGYHIR